MEKQMDLFEVNWGVRADLKDVQEKLWDLIPTSGSCESPRSKNKHLDRFRRAANLGYDLFNNGLMNRRSEFKKFFGFVPIPAPALISPVGFSSTEILIILVIVFVSSVTSLETVLKKFKLFKLLIDLLTKISLKGSPSSTSS